MQIESILPGDHSSQENIHNPVSIPSNIELQKRRSPFWSGYDDDFRVFPSREFHQTFGTPKQLGYIRIVTFLVWAGLSTYLYTFLPNFFQFNRKRVEIEKLRPQNVELFQCRIWVRGLFKHFVWPFDKQLGADFAPLSDKLKVFRGN